MTRFKKLLAKIISRPTESGFFLLEVIIAVFILEIGVIGTVLLLKQASSSVSVSASRLVAAQLAQEGIEIVKNIRDINYNEIDKWGTWYNSISGISYYLVQYNDVALRTFSDTALKLNSVTGLYGYDAGGAVPADFKRKIILEKISADEVKVVTEMTWQDRGRSYTLEAEDRLWNWR